MILVDEGLEILDEAECLRLLGGAKVGRVGVSVGALPAIFPVNFVLSDGAIVFRTGEGTKLTAALRHAVVAFEVDDWDSFEHGGWSVLVVGQTSVVDDPDQLTRFQHMALVPWAGGRRDCYVRLPVEFISGRRINHGAPPGPPPDTA